MSRSILKSTSKIGILALISRCIAFLREYFLIRFLSVGDASDIFFTAFRIPNTMRKIFAEGLLSSILIPAIVNAEHKGGSARASRLTTLAFLQIESYIALFCILIFFNAEWAIGIITPGFTPEKIAASGKLLKILISFILFISSGAIFAAALQAQKKFFIPAIAPAILNILYVASLAFCWYQKCTIETFCFYMIGIAIFHFLLHVGAYLYMQFTFEKPIKETYQDFKIVLLQFLPCFLSVGILEINHFINTGFASYLPGGSLTLIRTAFQFVNIPVGIIAASLSTVLLPHFSKLHIEEPKSLSLHIFEAIKFTLWSTLPICFLLGFFSQEIFQTLFIGDAQAMAKVPLAQSVFIGYLIGLLAFSLNKIFLSIFYALRLSFVPMIATTISIIVNYILNSLLMHHYQAAGIALASSIASILQTIFFMIFLHAHLKLTFPWKDYSQFFARYFSQLALFCGLFWILFRTVFLSINNLKFAYHLSILHFDIVTINPDFFTHSIGIWCWAGPLSLALLWSLYITRSYFSLSLAYFDKK